MSNDDTSLQDLAEHFLREITSLRQKRKYDVGVEDMAVRPLLDAWATTLEWAKTAGLSPDGLGAIVRAAREVGEQVGVYRSVEGELKGDALANVAANLDVFLSIFDELEKAGASPAEFKKYRELIERSREESERITSVMVYVTQRTSQLDQAVSAAQGASVEAKNALALARKAVSEGATSALERSFQTTAKTNSRNATWFRSLTIGVLSVAVGIGTWFALSHDRTAAVDVDWYGLAYRLAVLSGLAAIATYLGRQSAHYRRIATWAQGIEIQLKAFLGFVNEIEDEGARQTMYALFGKRVLEAPPDGKTPDDSVTNVIQPIIEHIGRARPPVT